MIRMMLMLVVALVCSACGERAPKGSNSTLNRQQRDSVLAESDLPGAKTIGKAIAVTDSAAARTERLNRRSE